MAKNVTPPPLLLLEAITAQLAVLFEDLDRVDTWKTVLTESRTLEAITDHPQITQYPQALLFCQLLLLSAVSLHEGILIPSLKQISVKENALILTWEGGIRDQLQWGVWDDGFKRFLRWFKKNVLKKRDLKTELAFSLLDQTMAFISREKEVLGLCRFRLFELGANKPKALAMIQDDFNADFLFVLMSVLPPEALNALYLYLNQFFPPDLVVHIPQPVQVGSLLQTPSQDTHFLMEKTRLYYFLYLSNEQPIIRLITRSKTREFLEQLIQSDAVYALVQQQISSLIQNQMDPRLGLYNLLEDFFKTL